MTSNSLAEKRLAAAQIQSTAESRRAYRELFFTTPQIASFVSGVILQDETIRQQGSKGAPLVQVLTQQGSIPGIKVDNGESARIRKPGITPRYEVPRSTAIMHAHADRRCARRRRAEHTPFL